MLLEEFDSSRSNQREAPAVRIGFSPNTGRLYKNLIFLALRQKTQDIYYYASPGGYELHLYLLEKCQLIQSSKIWIKLQRVIEQYAP